MSSEPSMETKLNPHEFLTGYGLEELADQRIEAHGQEFTVAEAVVECPPFAKMVTSLSANLEAADIPEDARKQILTKSIMDNAPEETNYAVESKKNKASEAESQQKSEPETEPTTKPEESSAHLIDKISKLQESDPLPYEEVARRRLEQEEAAHAQALLSQTLQPEAKEDSSSTAVEIAEPEPVPEEVPKESRETVAEVTKSPVIENESKLIEAEEEKVVEPAKTYAEVEQKLNENEKQSSPPTIEYADTEETTVVEIIEPLPESAVPVVVEPEPELEQPIVIEPLQVDIRIPEEAAPTQDLPVGEDVEPGDIVEVDASIEADSLDEPEIFEPTNPETVLISEVEVLEEDTPLNEYLTQHIEQLVPEQAEEATSLIEEIESAIEEIPSELLALDTDSPSEELEATEEKIEELVIKLFDILQLDSNPDIIKSVVAEIINDRKIYLDKTAAEDGSREKGTIEQKPRSLQTIILGFIKQKLDFRAYLGNFTLSRITPAMTTI